MSILDRFKLNGKTALVTGARRGIGKAMAIALAEAGADIVATSAAMEPEGSDIAKQIAARGRRVWCRACDLADRRAVYALIAEVKSGCPPIDILINNGGTILRTPAAEHPDEYWDKVIEVDLSAQFVLAREFGRGMVERGAGKIVFTASLLSFQGGITVPGYASAKGGVAQLAKALANEWAGKNVQVNAIAPGYIATDNTEALRADPVRSPAILARIPAGRWGDPSDLAGAVVFLASAASDYVSGEVLTVDGGWMGR
ncbi:MAG TPA: SDR family oxidoreductase [Candidatus Acidoferrales bacterium]|nr:SDR family oxidoreductase [Candidatus Acidoferrales bacterium]HTS62769.1 SDR family oxidoreductase [Candidatus Acidoferrales bacterium]